MNNTKNIDELVDRITQKVKAELKGVHLPKEPAKSNEDRKIVGFSLSGSTDSDKASKIASMIDHTHLKPDASKEVLKKLCDEAKAYNCKTVCVNSSNISYVNDQLKGSNVLPIAVVGFPLGAMTTEAKVFETREAVRKGAKEIDMVINIGELKSKEYRAVFEDIKRVVEASKPYPVKVIIETSLLDTEEKIIASALSKVANAEFVKTSTGFSGGGATVEDIKLIRMVVGDEVKIKASGGIRSYEDAVKMIEAGADRIGASKSVAIIEEARKR